MNEVAYGSWTHNSRTIRAVLDWWDEGCKPRAIARGLKIDLRLVYRTLERHPEPPRARRERLRREVLRQLAEGVRPAHVAKSVGWTVSAVYNLAARQRVHVGLAKRVRKACAVLGLTEQDTIGRLLGGVQ